MKKLLLLPILLFLGYSLFAQTTLTSFEPIAKKPKINALLSNANPDGEIAISYIFNGKIYWNLIDKNGEVLVKKAINAQTTRLSPRGAIFANNRFFHFYKNGDNQQIEIIESDNQGQNIKLFPTKILAKKERFIGAIADQNQFFLLALNKKEKTLKVSKFDPDQQKFVTTDFEIKDYIVDKLNKVKFTPIRKNDLLSPYQAAALLKLYVLNDQKLLLTIDGEKARGKGTTELLTLDLAQRKLENQIVGKNTFTLDDRTKSLVYQNHLYRIGVNREMLNISIYQLADLTLKKEYQFTTNDEIDLLDSPFFSESDGNNGFYLFTPSNKTLDKPDTKKLLKKLAVGAPFILPQSLDSNQLLLTVGTHIVVNQGGYFMPGMPGGTINTPGGPVATPGTPASYVGGGGGYKQSRFFYSIFDETNFEHIANAERLKKSIHPVHKFVDNQLTNKHISAVIPYGKQTAVVHYLRSDRLIEVEVFE